MSDTTNKEYFAELHSSWVSEIVIGKLSKGLPDFSCVGTIAFDPTVLG